MSTISHGTFKFFWENLKLLRTFKEKNEENSYHIQNILEKSKILTIDVYYSVQLHGVNQIYHVILKLENQQTMTIIGPKFILL